MSRRLPFISLKKDPDMRECLVPDHKGPRLLPLTKFYPKDSQCMMCRSRYRQRYYIKHRGRILAKAQAKRDAVALCQN